MGRGIDLPLEQRAELLEFVRRAARASSPRTSAADGARVVARIRRDDRRAIRPASRNRRGGTIVDESPISRDEHFPLTYAFNDEHYQPKNLSRDKVEVLLRLDPTRSA